MSAEEVERIRARWSNGPTGRYSAGTEAADQRDVESLLRITGDLLAALERVEALADEWDETAGLQLAANPLSSPVAALGHCAHRLRAALSDPGRSEGGA